MTRVKKWGLIASATVLATALLKLAWLSLHGSKAALVVWIPFSAVMLWITWGYANNRDMPSRGGMNYDGGRNQFGRTLYLVVMLGLYAFVVIAMK